MDPDSNNCELTSEEDDDEEDDDDDEEDECDEDDEDTEESTSDSDGELSSQDTSTSVGGASFLNHSSRLEEVCLGSARIALPQGLCENPAIFKEFFSMDTWNQVLSDQQRQNLKQYLPSFPENNDREQEETLSRLFSGSNFKFGNPINKLFSELHGGALRPDIAKMRLLLKRAQHREYRYRQRRHQYSTMQSLLVLRRRLLSAAESTPPDVSPRVERLMPPPHASSAEQRARRRYFEELRQIRKSQAESSQSSEDENYPEGAPPQLNKRQKKHFSSMKQSLSPDLPPIWSTLSSLSSAPSVLESQVASACSPMEITEESYKTMLLSHRQQRSTGEEQPELDVSGVQLQDVVQRLTTPRRVPSRSPAHPAPPHAEPGGHPRSRKKIKMDQGTTPLASSFTSDVHNSSSFCSEDSGSMSFSEAAELSFEPTEKVAAPSQASTPRRKSHSGSVTPLLPLERIKQEEPDEPQFKEELIEVDDPIPLPASPVVASPAVRRSTPSPAPPPPKPAEPERPAVVVNPPVELKPISVVLKAVKVEESKVQSVGVNTLPPAKVAELELVQEMHSCFLSLVRDIICSTPDQRMGLVSLEQRLRAWQDSPISALNTWYTLAPSWVQLLPSAVNFLSGDFPVETQPEDFVPYLEYKPHMQAYQWIGAGRDSDHHLGPLCAHWLERRHEVPAVSVREEGQREEPGASSPPPPRYPTTWQARRATGLEREHFHLQEKKRFENPLVAFTYRMHGFESVVGPIKGVGCSVTSQSRPARGHTLLVVGRPHCVTILSLVRDAMARLPNGEGTKQDICELLRDSQYIVSGSEENYLQSVVGGALDRLHFEPDPPVKYDAKRKFWIYTHRNRTEQDFEKFSQLHQHKPAQSKSKRPAVSRRGGASPAVARGRGREVGAVHVVTSALASALADAKHLPAASTPTLPTPVAPVKASPVATTVSRNVATTAGTLQSLQVTSSSSGLQASQASVTSTAASTSSLLSSAASQAIRLSAVASAASKKSKPPTSAGLTAQPTARLMVTTGGTVTVSKAPSGATVLTQSRPAVSSAVLHSSAGTQTTAVSTSAATSPLLLHPVAAAQARALSQTTAATAAGKALLAGVNISQLQLVKALQQQQQKQQLQQLQQQKQLQLQQQQKQVQQLQQQQQQSSAQETDQAAQQKQAILLQQAQRKQQLELQQQKQQLLASQLQQLQEASLQPANKAAVVSKIAAGMKLLNAQATMKSFASGGGSPMHGTQAIFIKHGGVVSSCEPSSSTSSSSSVSSPQLSAVVTSSTLSAALLMSNRPGLAVQAASGAVTTPSPAGCSGTPAPALTSVSKPTVAPGAAGKPMVAKMLANAQGQIISMESLLAHQKQLAAASAGTVRMAGAKPGTAQASLIQLPGPGGVPQFAMVAPSGLMGPRLLQAAAQQLSQHQAQQLAQQQAKPRAAATAAGGLPTSLRMVTPVSTTACTSSINVATIGGQQVLLTSKSQATMAGQNVFLSSGAGGQAVVLASASGLRATPQGGTLLLQPGGTQQLVLPQGFQGGTLNLKALQSLQGIRVIPLAQASAAAAAAANARTPKGRQQVYARIITPQSKAAAPAPNVPGTASGVPEGGAQPPTSDSDTQ